MTMKLPTSTSPTEAHSAAQARQDIRRSSIIQDVAGQAFRQTYLSSSSVNELTWTSVEQGYVSRIKAVPKGEEESLYTGDAPLLCLINHLSDKIAANGQEVLVFRARNDSRAIADQYRRPDIVVAWEQSNALSEPASKDSHIESPTKTWTELAAVGQVKVIQSGQEQLADYLRHHLRFHPELNATLGFTCRSNGYALFYHDASVIHRSEFGWEPGPLYEFIQKLYTRPFRDTSMQIQNAQGPTWATKIGNDVYSSRTPSTQAGPGQRRYTTEAVNDANTTVFIKDIWRDQRRFFFEALLLNRAHENQTLCGLVLPTSHGYVLDETGAPIRTTSLNPASLTPAPGRFKMRMVTEEVGLPLNGVHPLYEFLCAMYDACAVQRNLYRKCRIMHRDISDNNIMLAPGTETYRQRNQKGYADVKFINQVMAKDRSVEPDPACLVIDLGNGADLTVERGTDASTERVGTPKFIARSVSSGELLEYSSSGVTMPRMEGQLADYQQFMHANEYQSLSNSGSATESEVEFAHRLFHDAESTFWVIAWTLARSIKAGSEQELEPHIRFSEFFHIMSRHNPTPGRYDSRLVFGASVKHWESILHPDLIMLAPMLSKMFNYIRPEWAYRAELNAEHAHEALMRLLLAQIVTITGEGADINIDIGGRNPPPPLDGEDSLPRSMTNSRSKSGTPSQATRSTEPQTNSTAGASGSTGSFKRRNKSGSAAPDPSALSERMENLTLGSGPACGTRFQQRNRLAQESCRSTYQPNSAAQIAWAPEPCKLLEPAAHGESNPLPR